MSRRASTDVFRRLLQWTALALLASPCSSGVLMVEVLQRDGKPLAGAVVLLEAESPTLPPATPVQSVMDQVDLTFVPDVLVLPAGSSVLFPNSDEVRHQVYSFSDARAFQLPLYRGKPYPPVTFPEPGIVTLGCNIHDNMIAYIVVTDAPYFGRTDRGGSWITGDVPAGRYRLRIWHPLMNEDDVDSRAVEIGDQRISVDVKLKRSLKPAPLSGRPHSWDY